MEEVVQTPKKSSKKTLIIVLSVVGGLILISIIVGIMALKGFFNYAKNAVEDSSNTDQQTSVENEDEDVVEADVPLIDQDLEESTMVTSDFPSDIPLPGGKVIGSSSDEWSIKVQISTSSTLDDTFDWYINALEEAEWTVTSKSKDSGYAEIKFERDDRRGDVKLMNYEWNATTWVEVRELVF